MSGRVEFWDDRAYPVFRFYRPAVTKPSWWQRFLCRNGHDFDAPRSDLGHGSIWAAGETNRDAFDWVTGGNWITPDGRWIWRGICTRCRIAEPARPSRIEATR